jgi:hypothetical protein
MVFDVKLGCLENIYVVLLFLWYENDLWIMSLNNFAQTFDGICNRRGHFVSSKLYCILVLSLSLNLKLSNFHFFTQHTQIESVRFNTSSIHLQMFRYKMKNWEFKVEENWPEDQICLNLKKQKDFNWFKKNLKDWNQTLKWVWCYSF